MLNSKFVRGISTIVTIAFAVTALVYGTLFIRDRNISVEEDVVYKTVDGKDLKLDVYMPENKMPVKLHPAVMIVHGGGWTNRSGDMESIARRLAREGFVAFNITYRLAPMSLFPKPVDDVKDAAKWIIDHASKYNIDTERIGGWGYSAGSNLVLLASLDTNLGFKAIVAGGTPADLPYWPDSPIIPKFIGHSFQERPELWREASPDQHVTDKSPAVFLYHGEKDSLVEPIQMEFMAKALAEKHVPVETFLIPYLGHIPVYLFSREAVTRGVDFLKRKLG